jgi:L-ascorbate metabolism protein UlaG (beta-lactamase superfamily)
MDAARAHVTVTDTIAVVAPVVIHGRGRSSELSVTLHRTAAGWKVRSTEYLSQIPFELTPAGPGAEYFALADRWAAANVAWAGAVLRANPPNGGDSTLRSEALQTLDEPFHLRSAANVPAVGNFLRQSVDSAIAQIRRERVTSGATLWKLYNQGWVVRTANHTWAFDFYEGPDRARMTDEQIDAILGRLDAVFYSHWHSDHVAMRVVKRAVDKRVPVFLPPFPEGGQGGGARSQAASLGSAAVVVPPGADGEVSGITYHAYPGHQDGMPNNCIAATADGMTILHAGDQRWAADSTWIDRVGDELAVDVLLPPIWMIDDTEKGRWVQGIRPRVIIPGHENELQHGFDGRFPYHRDYDLLTPLSQEWYAMAWGERVHIEPR